MQPPLLVLFTGHPCTGKTALARQLAVELNLPLVTKDDIKERLFNRLGWSDRQWSQKLGMATFDLMFYFIELEISAGQPLIAEARFFPQFHLEVFKQIQQRHPFRPLVIECVADGEILFQRFVRRSESGERHPGHLDHKFYAEAREIFLGEQPAPFDLGGTYLRVDTSSFAQVNIQALADAIRAEL